MANPRDPVRDFYGHLRVLDDFSVRANSFVYTEQWRQYSIRAIPLYELNACVAWNVLTDTEKQRVKDEYARSDDLKSKCSTYPLLEAQVNSDYNVLESALMLPSITYGIKVSYFPYWVGNIDHAVALLEDKRQELTRNIHHVPAFITNSALAKVARDEQELLTRRDAYLAKHAPHSTALWLVIAREMARGVYADVGGRNKSPLKLFGGEQGICKTILAFVFAPERM